MISRISLVDQVIDALTGGIIAGDTPIGTRLPPESALTRQLGVGRSTLREAVRILAHQGVLEVRQGDGTYVRGTPLEPLERRLRRAALTEIVEVRHLLEVGAAELAARRATTQQLGALEAALEARGRGGPEFVTHDLAFHRAVVEAAQNAVLSELFAQFRGSLRRLLEAGADRAG
ncbi:MAG: FadR/GntR family transcriptional regulator, partial [Candidatus Dormibacteraceae bacterium]